jgi:DNA-binding GntR family transcriptional regulator
MSVNFSDNRRPLGRVSTSEAIANELSRAILDGAIEPGTHLREVELSEQFGVSRQSLRAALAELAHQGLLQREPHRGVMVPVLTRDDASEIFELRQMIEGQAVRKLAATPATWEPVEEAVQHLEHLAPGTPWSTVTEADAAVHRAAVAAVGSSRLSRMHDQLLSEIRLLIVPARHFQSQEELARDHRELLADICSGDPDVAERRLRQHLEFGLEQLLEQLPPADAD